MQGNIGVSLSKIAFSKHEVVHLFVMVVYCLSTWSIEGNYGLWHRKKNCNLLHNIFAQQWQSYYSRYRILFLRGHIIKIQFPDLRLKIPTPMSWKRPHKEKILLGWAAPLSLVSSWFFFNSFLLDFTKHMSQEIILKCNNMLFLNLIANVSH